MGRSDSAIELRHRSVRLSCKAELRELFFSDTIVFSRMFIACSNFNRQSDFFQFGDQFSSRFETSGKGASVGVARRRKWEDSGIGQCDPLGFSEKRKSYEVDVHGFTVYSVGSIDSPK